MNTKHKTAGPVQEELERLAYQAKALYWSNTTDRLEELSPLRGAALGEAWDEFCQAMDLLNGVESGAVHWSEVVPDADGYDRDGQALKAAYTFVELALDRLTGGA